MTDRPNPALRLALPLAVGLLAAPALAQQSTPLPPPVPPASSARSEPSVGERAGAAVERAATATGHALGRAAEATGDALGRAARKTGEALQRVGEWTERQGEHMGGGTARQP
ncbi:MAG: hypothetical protein QJR07_05225 [Acetobacteraceae bacterium]|nr:hypothetical protein [Acetobacteraceae bacterium]